ncbi:BlaI/MecI/CopY family transcriptional regulator [Hungatella effluvii]|uniref:BlaI/MecI/CopY family transcriptional regulator n=1 Tax=Hungatella effluvii TaxID=1096246 RepID=UPI0022DFFF55|nr:BlaI/MecI/CopY family transcriptional regulator [Hungatella effluvii]
MSIKLFDSELKIMDLLWKEGGLSAKEIAGRLAASIGWSKTTTYTVIKKCIEKQALRRVDPGFICYPLITIEEARKAETNELIDKMYGGSRDLLIASLLNEKAMTPEEIEKLKKLVRDLE